MKSLLLAFLILLALLPVAKAENSLEYRSFAQIPVLENGRVKPLERFAAIQLHRISGTDSFEGRPAIIWLAEALFNPAAAANQSLFAVDRQAVRAALGLGDASRFHRFSLAELAPGLGKTADQVEALLQRKSEELSADEQALVDLHSQVLIFNQLLQSLSLLLPLPVAVPAEAGAEPTQRTHNFVDMMRSEPELIEKVRGFLTPANTANPDLLTEPQQQLAQFVYALSKLREGGAHNILLRVIPSVWRDSAGEWFSPWQTILEGQSAPQIADLLKLWQDMAMAYRAGDGEIWQSATEKAVMMTRQLMHDAELERRLDTEVLYDRLHPYPLTGILYGLTALLAVLALRGVSWSQTATTLVFTIACALHTMAIAMRIVILNRPPVGTLYESLLFVGLVIGLVCLGVSAASRKPALALGGALGAALLLALAPLFETDGESLTMLSAVLNTNFWLSTHVLCITAGYGLCLVTALLAHGLLVVAPRKTDNPAGKTLLYKLSIISLLLTTVGTLLGGVWADQSWGRFWGWDPKENGALLIVLWLLWLQHGRLGGQLSHLAWLSGCAFLTVIVALAWFGVNLLGIGLHSYGFTTGIAAGLVSFCLAELLLIAGLWYRGRRHVA
jgi:ABC-type transport system involved in cytochrome c biogenesis permease subunit